MLSLRTLGEVRLFEGSGAELLAGRRKELVLLAYIARSRPRTVSRAELAALLWGERREANARNSLRQALLHLKRALGEECLRAMTEGVSLEASALALDLTEFENAIAGGRFPDAVALWRGDFLHGVDSLGAEPCRLWIDQERQRVRTRLAWSFEQLVDDANRRGDHLESTRWAELWAGALPLDEQAQIRLVPALLLTGRTGDARAHHAAFLARYREAFACDPSPQFLRLTADLESAPVAARLPHRSLGSAVPAFVGRVAALAELTDTWRGVSDGSGAVLLVIGDEGVGKTKLLEEFARWVGARERDALVLTTRASADQQTESWSVLRALLAKIVDAPGLIGISPEMLGELTRLLPAIRSRFPRLPPPSGDEFAMREAVAHVVSSVASEVPILLVVDDAHHADAATLQVFEALAARGDARRALLLLSGRSEQAHGSPAFEALRRHSRVHVVRLSGLGMEEVRILVTTLLAGDHGSLHSLVESLFRDTEGNPRFVVETLDALVAEKRLHRDEHGVWTLTPTLAERPLPVAPGIRSAATRRLAAVTPEAREVAETLAVAPGPLDVQTLARVRRLSTASLCAALDELAGQRLLLPVMSERPNEIAFINESTRRTIALTISGDRRETLQSAIAGLGAQWPQNGSQLRPSTAHRRSRLRLAAFALVLFVLAGIGAAVVTQRRAGESNGIVAVGLIRDFSVPGGAVGGAMADMLATNLARVPTLRVLSNARMLGVVRELQLADGRSSDSLPSRQMMWRAAEVAGASEVIEGELYPEERGLLRLDLRRVDARSGIVRDVATVRGASVFQLVDEATRRLATGSAMLPDTLRIADVTTSSLAAYRFYEEGLRAYYQYGDVAAAKRFFQAAAREDSTFAMAPYYLAVLAGGGPGQGWEQFERADRLANRTSDRERLLIRARWALERNDAAAAAFAETLAVRYPNEPDGALALAGARTATGRFLEAIELARRVLMMDSLTVRAASERALHGTRGGQLHDDSVAASQAGSGRCLVCDALYTMAWCNWALDSTLAAVREDEEVVRLRPRSGAWFMLAWAYQYAERYPEALRSFRRAQELGTDNIDAAAPAFYVSTGIRSGDFGMVNRLVDGMIQSEAPGAEWLAAIALRHQGRLAEALAQARRQRAREESADTSHIIAFDGAIMEALVLFEMGRGREAAARFDSLAARSAPRGDVLRPRSARHRAWMLTHAASSLASIGDTAPLARLADSIRVLGNQSNYGRDQRLYHHVRGLLYAARGQFDSAQSEFRQAIFTWTLGYTRSNLELGRALFALHRPREAISALRPALHGALDASNLYVTRTELQEELARAFDAAGERDSARVYYVRVANAWRNADPQFSARRRQAVARATALGAAGLELSNR